jgi:hypothetical protein
VKFLLGWFGYAKVPREVLDLALNIEGKLILSRDDDKEYADVVKGLRVLIEWIESARGLQ